jgi:hypothetical protein
MKVEILTDAQVDTTQVVRGGAYSMTLKLKGEDIAELYAYDDEGHEIGSAYLAVGPRGGFSVCPIGRRGRQHGQRTLREE